MSFRRRRRRRASRPLAVLAAGCLAVGALPVLATPAVAATPAPSVTIEPLPDVAVVRETLTWEASGRDDDSSQLWMPRSWGEVHYVVEGGAGSGVPGCSGGRGARIEGTFPSPERFVMVSAGGRGVGTGRGDSFPFAPWAGGDGVPGTGTLTDLRAAGRASSSDSDPSPPRSGPTTPATRCRPVPGAAVADCTPARRGSASPAPSPTAGTRPSAARPRGAAAAPRSSPRVRPRPSSTPTTGRGASCSPTTGRSRRNSPSTSRTAPSSAPDG